MCNDEEFQEWAKYKKCLLLQFFVQKSLQSFDPYQDVMVTGKENINFF